MNRLKSDGEEIQIVGSVHVDCDWDKDAGHGVNIGFVTYKQLIGELIGTMKYRREITKSTMRDVSWHIFRLYAEHPALRSERDYVWHDRMIGQRIL